MRAKKTYNGEPIERGSDNVFADLGLPNPEERQRKAILAERITSLIKEGNLTQTEAGKLLGIDQAKVSKLTCGRLREFSISTLMEYLTVLGQDVEIVVRPHEDNASSATIRVTLSELHA